MKSHFFFCLPLFNARLYALMINFIMSVFEHEELRSHVSLNICVRDERAHACVCVCLWVWLRLAVRFQMKWIANSTHVTGQRHFTYFFVLQNRRKRVFKQRTDELEKIPLNRLTSSKEFLYYIFFFSCDNHDINRLFTPRAMSVCSWQSIEHSLPVVNGCVSGFYFVRNYF